MYEGGTMCLVEHNPHGPFPPELHSFVFACEKAKKEQLSLWLRSTKGKKYYKEYKQILFVVRKIQINSERYTSTWGPSLNAVNH